MKKKKKDKKKEKKDKKKKDDIPQEQLLTLHKQILDRIKFLNSQ